MKKLINLPILLMLAAALPAIEVHADTTISLGGNLNYSVWQPPWSSGKTNLPPYHFMSFFVNPDPGYSYLWSRSLPYRINKYGTIHGPMAGPSLSVSFAERWSLSSVFLAGKYLAESTGPAAAGITEKLYAYMPPPGDTVMFFKSRYHRNITRYDSDTTIGCSIHRYVKFFIGFKYQGYTYAESMEYFTTQPGYYNALGMARFHSYGGGTGFGFSIPLHRVLFLQVNLSGLAMYGTAAYQYSRQYSVGSNMYLALFTQFTRDRYWSAGGNATLTLAYQIEAANLTLAIGGRYQALYYFWQKNNPQGFIDYDGSFDHFYGGMFSIIYSFAAGKQG